LFPLYKIDPTIPIEQLNVAWDHACNVVVLQPLVLDNGTVITTKQVSEYDAQVRPQRDYVFDPNPCQNCWKKAAGLGGLDFGTFASIWNPELNCGDSCTFYTVEEHYVDGTLVLPRAIIGRSYRTGQLINNITDSIQAATISWNPFVIFTSTGDASINQFLGIGICCTEKWCHPSCASLDNHMVLFSYNPYSTSSEKIIILSDIGNIIDPETIRLGVEYSPPFTTQYRHAYVFYGGKIVTFDLVLDANLLVLSAKKSGESPAIDVDLYVWAAPAF